MDINEAKISITCIFFDTRRKMNTIIIINILRVKISNFSALIKSALNGSCRGKWN